MSCVIILTIWIVLGFSLNMVKISQVLVHLHWYRDSPCAHVKGTSSGIHKKFNISWLSNGDREKIV
jgi:hypothetical protein